MLGRKYSFRISMNGSAEKVPSKETRKKRQKVERQKNERFLVQILYLPKMS